MLGWCQSGVKISGRRRSSEGLRLGSNPGMSADFSLPFDRVGERVRLRHDLHPQRGHERAAGGCGGPQTGGDQLLPHQGEWNNLRFRWTPIIQPCLRKHPSSLGFLIQNWNVCPLLDKLQNFGVLKKQTNRQTNGRGTGGRRGGCGRS